MLSSSSHSITQRLARIRCLKECIECLKEGRALPEPVCYVPSEVEFKCSGNAFIDMYSAPDTSSDKIGEMRSFVLSRLVASGEEFCNAQGRWLKVRKVRPKLSTKYIDVKRDGWILLYSKHSTTEEQPIVEPVKTDAECYSKWVKLLNISSWESLVEHHFALKFKIKVNIVPPESQAVKRLHEMLPNWTLEHDEALVHLMADSVSQDGQYLGNLRNYVDSVDVSSYCVSEEAGPLNLTDDDPDTTWESEGGQGQHWIKLRMKKGTIIKKLFLTLSGADDIYLPSKVVVHGGEEFNMKELNSVNLERPVNSVKDICVLEYMTEHFPMIMVKIRQADGLDVRVRGLKIQSSEERNLGFDEDFFSAHNLFRYPRLEAYTPSQLYRRSILLQRFINLLDSVLAYIIPKWNHKHSPVVDLEAIRQLLPLSRVKPLLIETFLRETVKERPLEAPKLYINRQAAMEHRSEPSKDAECKNTIFMQVFEGLKPTDRHTKSLNYRWSGKHDQWWECKFLMEGIIDQGGGFRDSLSDIAEELCPSSADDPVALPFFIRSPNQAQEDSNVNRDAYIPNPSCKLLDEFEWIGQLMGACFRSKENLVLSLPPFIWKKLSGENVTWECDFSTVDAAEVKLLENLQTLDQKHFQEENRYWSTTLSDGTQVMLRVDGEGNPKKLKCEDRHDYCLEVQKIRMSENSEQIHAIRRGILKVIPQDVLSLITWQGLEKRICGDTQITLEALQKSVHLVDLDQNDIRVKYFWEAMKNFSNEDRSRLLRFVTGRRRLPAPIYLSTGKPEADNCLPESSTCGNMLFMPKYSSAKIAEEKLQYAAYNCVAIDTDVSPWDN